MQSGDKEKLNNTDVVKGKFEGAGPF